MKRHLNEFETEFKKLCKIYRLVCELEKRIFCDESFKSTYKQIIKLLKKDYNSLFIYKLEYETNRDVLNYVIKLLSNQFHLLKINSYYYDIDTSIKAENYMLTLKEKQYV